MPADKRQPRPSSTVVLVRPTDEVPEVFMVKRHARASFGSRYAFPGGVREACDATVDDYCHGVTAAEANALLGLDAGGLQYYSAAIRELFEESGVLLAAQRLSAAELRSARDGLNGGTLDWREFVAKNQLKLQCDRLHYFSFWITPAGEPKRYSTRFFLAKVPRAQAARHDGSELTESCWLSARRALEARKQKKIKLPSPTRKTLKRVAEFADTGSLLAWAKACSAEGVICNQPAFRPELIS
jgi:8-oxo-dGTP pyrophosphatase MutT (NUDIX family)